MEVKAKWRLTLAVYVVVMLVCAALILSGQEYVAAHTPRVEPNPHVNSAEYKHDFGRVREGVILHHRFQIRNTGKQELKLYRKKLLEPIRVAPGGVTEIKVTLHTAGRWRRVRKVVRCYTNDPARSVLTLTVTAMVGD